MIRSRFLRAVALFAFITTIAVMFTAAAAAQSSPRIYASDLQSGPNTGGEAGNGAWVTIYGSRFGSTRGSSTVTLGGVPAFAYASWSDKKITFQVANTAASGDIVVNVNGVRSNAIPFAVRSGFIYFVSPNGSDTQSGTFGQPWRTLAKAVATMQPGDITYAMNGTAARTLNIVRAGASGKPFAIVAYPNASVVIGSKTSNHAITASVGGYDSWVLSGLTLRAAVSAVEINGVTDWRLVGNDLSCPNGSGATACLHATSVNGLTLLANKVHDSGVTGSPDYASVQLAASNVEVGWNEIGNTRSCRALAFSSADASLSGLSVHDNYIHDAVCDGISFANVDPSASAVTAYNNIIKHVGSGPASGGAGHSYACVQASGSGTGTVEILNNTLYDCGTEGDSNSGAIAAGTPVLFTNNIVSLLQNQEYVARNTDSSLLSGSNDLFWGQSSIPTAFSNSLNLDPQFVDVANSDFAVQSASPAIDMGANTGVATDYTGTERPQGKAVDIGAMEFASGGSTATGNLAASPSALDFGTVDLGTTNTQSVTLSNTGIGSATISQISVTGAAFSATGLTLPMTLSPGQSTSFIVTYAPQTAGSSVGSVALISDAVDSTSTVQLIGTATAPTSTGSVTMTSAATTSPTLSALTLSTPACPCSLWPSSTVPSVAAASDSNPLEVGVKFKSDVNGYITGIRFYKGSTNTGTHVGHLWTSTGTLLASATFTNETASGWQQVNFANPVAVTAGTVYVASYFAPTGRYAVNQNYFTTARDAAPLHALQDGASGVNGVFTYSASSAFPKQGWYASNYWVDVVFNTSVSNTAGTLSPSPTALSFGNVNVGSSATQTVTVTASSASVTISQASTAGAGFTVSGPTLPVTLAAGQSASFNVKFAPTAAGSVTGSLSLASNASNTPTTIALSGSGVSAAGTLSASPTSLSFGNVNVGSNATQTVTVTASSASVTISQANATGAGFTVSGPALPVTLAAGQSASFAVKFAPTATGNVTGSLSLASNASSTPTPVTLTGSGVSVAGALSASPTSLSFGNVTVGSSTSQSVSVTAGTSSVTISQANVTGAGFAVTGPTLPVTLAAGQSASFAVKFAPTAAGSVTGSLSLASNASNTPTAVSLSGSGVSSTPTAYTIWSAGTTPGTVDAGDGAAVELGVQFKSDVSGYISGIRYYKSSNNTGTHIGNLWTSSGTKLASATFTNETASGWQQVNFSSPVAITAGTIYVASYYTPTGHYSDDQNYFTATYDKAPLHVQQNGGVFAYGSSSSFPSQTWNASNYWVDVVFSTTSTASSGSGTTTSGTLSASPSSLSFGNVSVGSSATQTVTVTASTGSVTISQANTTGAGFTVSGPALPVTLAAGQSASFTVKFAPGATGSVSGSLSLASNVTNTPTTVALSGSGTSTTSTSHSATLNWNASSGAAGYYVYRSTQSGSGYTKLTSTALTGTSYQDSAVTAGTTYYYVVTAVNGSGVESSYSTQVTAVIPAP